MVGQCQVCEEISLTTKRDDAGVGKTLGKSQHGSV